MSRNAMFATVVIVIIAIVVFFLVMRASAQGALTAAQKDAKLAADADDGGPTGAT